MKAWQLGGIMALLVGVAAGAPQDKPKAEKCGSAGVCCPKEGKCQGDCRTICDRAGETLTSSRKKAGERMVKIMGSKCPCTAGECSAAGCEGCDLVRSKVFVPLMKERITARIKDWKKDVFHAVKAKDGKTAQVKCTFLKGDVCEPCTDSLADDILKKLQELFSGQKK
jgi:hypothetical protein